MLVQFLINGLSISVAGYRMVRTKNILSFDFANAVCFLFYLFFELYLYCCRGQELTDLSVKIADSIFESEWYTIKYSLKDRKCYRDVNRMLKMAIHRSQQGVVLKGVVQELCMRTVLGVSLFINYILEKTIYCILVLF